MRMTLKRLGIAAAIVTATTLLAGGLSHLPALAQTAAPSAAAPLAPDTVKALQQALSKQGIAVKTDGVFGDDTRAAIRQYQSLHHLPVTGEPDKATLDKLGVAGQRSDLPAGSQTTGGAGPGMVGQGMMTAEMMRMMQHMTAQSGMPGMMVEGQASMGSGMMMCPMMQMMMSAQTTADMQGRMGMLAMLSGVPSGAQEEMTADRVRTLLTQMLTQLGNPRLKLGEIANATDGSVTAEIVTIDGSLVQKLAFNRYPGLLRPVQ